MLGSIKSVIRCEESWVSWDAVVITGSSCGGGAERYFDGGPVLGAWILVNERLQEEGRCF